MAAFAEWASHRGGKRQRQDALAAMSSSSSLERNDCPLCTELLHSWACEELSAITLQRFAAAGVESGIATESS